MASERRIHPASLWGAVGVMVWVTGFFVLVAQTSAWREFAAWIIR